MGLLEFAVQRRSDIVAWQTERNQLVDLALLKQQRIAAVVLLLFGRRDIALWEDVSLGVGAHQDLSAGTLHRPNDRGVAIQLAAYGLLYQQLLIDQRIQRLFGRLGAHRSNA